MYNYYDIDKELFLVFLAICLDERDGVEKESLKIVLKVGGADAGSDVSYSHDEKKHKHKKKKKKKDRDRHRHAEVINPHPAGTKTDPPLPPI